MLWPVAWRILGFGMRPAGALEVMVWALEAQAARLGPVSFLQAINLFWLICRSLLVKAQVRGFDFRFDLERKVGFDNKGFTLCEGGPCVAVR